MLITTTPNVEGRSVVKYFGIVSGEAILGANLFKDLFAGIRRDIVGGRSGAYEKELRRAKEIALKDMEVAKKLGANAILGVELHTGTVTRLQRCPERLSRNCGATNRAT
jgi:uncharacterized protein YbjQ (UPF0145 family)